MAEDPVASIALEVRAGQRHGSELRVGKVTAVSGTRARVDILGATWLAVDLDSPVRVGDRVYLLQSGPTGVISGKLTSAVSDGVPVGALMPYAGSSTALPNGWVLCDGRAVSRADFPVLFDRLGTAYGAGDGSTTFNLPNLTHAFPMGTSPGTGLRGRGVTGGAETVTLTMAQIPAHNHGTAGDHTHTVPAYADDQVADGTTATVSDNVTSGTKTSSTAGAHTHEVRGSDAAHENLPPFLTFYYLIKVV